ncbi:MAG TPA: mechanosensitive ion channel, partial [Chromatiales bacterium]|nr:mechanosensitive ion channel [Chromatiales bacterium]
MDFDQLLQATQVWAGENAWIFQVFIVVFFVLLFNFVQRRVLRKLHDRLKRTRNPWDDAVIQAVQRPLSLMIWVVGISVAAGIAAQKNDASGLFSAIGPLREVAVIACIAWFMVRVIANFQDSVHIGEEGMDHTTVDALSKLARASVVITAALVVLQTLGFSISGVLAFGGVGGIAIGFAAKDLLANFFGGLMIYMDRPFSVGDWIRSPDREIEGTVEKI